VLVNLLENALKFSSPADVVSVTAESADGRVAIRVRDRGPGVPDADRDRIFDAFERGSGHAGGTGLGLAIARGFAEANDGRVSVEPASPHGGSVFIFDLPAVDGAALRR
jgi:two-component system, OmpR family, sensor histidine kinase KdpD